MGHEEWIVARKELLKKEKEFTRLRDELSAMQRALPKERVENKYVFDGPDGEETLADMFNGRSQLIVYHFMFDPDWEEGCKSCSILADHYAPSIPHLVARDVTMVTVSRAPLEKVEAFRKRMGWNFKWVSSGRNDFNYDYNVSFKPDQEEVVYNYRPGKFKNTEMPGISVFEKDAEGNVFHTYSSYGRGLETFLGVYQLLDIVPKGRDEGDLPYSMAWIKHHDKY